VLPQLVYNFFVWHATLGSNLYGAKGGGYVLRRMQASAHLSVWHSATQVFDLVSVWRQRVAARGHHGPHSLVYALFVWHAAPTQVVELVGMWRQRVADPYHKGKLSYSLTYLLICSTGGQRVEAACLL